MRTQLSNISSLREREREQSSPGPRNSFLLSHYIISFTLSTVRTVGASRLEVRSGGPDSVARLTPFSLPSVRKRGAYSGHTAGLGRSTSELSQGSAGNVDSAVVQIESSFFLPLSLSPGWKIESYYLTGKKRKREQAGRRGGSRDYCFFSRRIQEAR